MNEIIEILIDKGLLVCYPEISPSGERDIQQLEEAGLVERILYDDLILIEPR